MRPAPGFSVAGLGLPGDASTTVPGLRNSQPQCSAHAEDGGQFAISHTSAAMETHSKIPAPRMGEA